MLLGEEVPQETPTQLDAGETESEGVEVWQLYEVVQPGSFPPLRDIQTGQGWVVSCDHTDELIKIV